MYLPQIPEFFPEFGIPVKHVMLLALYTIAKMQYTTMLFN